MSDTQFGAVPGTDPNEIRRLKRRVSRLERLLGFAQAWEMSETEIQEAALEFAVEITGSEGGYLHFYDEDQEEIDLVTWSKEVLRSCEAAQDRHYPLQKAGVWADAVRLQQPVVHNDYRAVPEDQKGGLPEGHVPIRRHLSIPIMEGDRVVAVSGVGNKVSPYTEEDVYELQLLMNSMWSILQHRRSRSHLEISNRDGLTGIANRRRFDSMLATEWRKATRRNRPIGLLMLDLDHFKSFNDELGHLAGDDCLRSVASGLEETFQRAGDFVARFGGEEFVVVLADLPIEEIELAAERARAAVEALGIIHPITQQPVTASVGGAFMEPGSDQDEARLLEHADRLLYEAKTAGRNCVRVSLCNGHTESDSDD